MIDLAYTVSEAEFLEAGSKLASRKGIRQPLIVLHYVAVAVVLAAGLSLILMGSLAPGIFFIALGTALPFLRRYTHRKVLRSNYRGAPFMHSQVRAQIDESGISMTYATGSSVNAWEGHQACFETKDMIVLQISTTLVRVFPKRAFNAEQLAEFRKLLAEHGLSPN